MIKAGFIERIQSESDKRSAQIHITDDGKEILKQSRIHVETMFNDMFGMLSSEEIDTLKLIYKKMTQ